MIITFKYPIERNSSGLFIFALAAAVSRQPPTSNLIESTASLSLIHWPDDYIPCTCWPNVFLQKITQKWYSLTTSPITLPNQNYKERKNKAIKMQKSMLIKIRYPKHCHSDGFPWCLNLMNYYWWEEWMRNWPEFQLQAAKLTNIWLWCEYIINFLCVNPIHHKCWVQLTNLCYMQ